VPQIPGRLESLLADKHLLFETVHVAKDGRQIPVEVNAHLVDFKGKPASLAIARDVTARRQAQEDLKKAHEELEQRVRGRTAELTEVNRELLREIMSRGLRPHLATETYTWPLLDAGGVHEGIARELLWTIDALGTAC